MLRTPTRYWAIQPLWLLLGVRDNGRRSGVHWCAAACVAQLVECPLVTGRCMTTNSSNKTKKVIATTIAYLVSRKRI